MAARTGKIKADGEWKHWTFDFTVPEDSAERKYDMFSFYTDPVGGKGVGYLIDNLYVRENPKPDTRTIIFQADADNKTADFYGWKSKITTVNDPVDEGSKCYKVLPENDTEAIYVSCMNRINIKAGATYCVDFDVMLASSGTSENIDASFSGSVLFNMRYKDASGSTKDHIVGSSGKLTGDGEWKHVTLTFTVAAEYKRRILTVQQPG